MLKISLIYQYVMASEIVASFLLEKVTMAQDGKRVVWNSKNITSRRRAETDD